MRASILIVDDLKENLDALEALLGTEDYVVHRAPSGEQALKVLLKEKIDLILLDVCMPTINGIETAMLVRKHKKFVDLPVIFVTAADHDSTTVMDAYKLNAIDFIFKPINPEVLLMKVGIFLSILKKKERLILQERRQKEILKEHAIQLNGITSEIEEVKNALDEFTYIASHDLKEPLRGIYNYATFLSEDYGDILPEDGLKKLKTIIDLANRQDRQISALLEYSKAGREKRKEEEFEVSAVVEDVREDLSAIREKERVEIRVGGELPRLIGDEGVLGRVLYNLIVNGIKYNRSEEKELEVGFDKEKELFYVKDNGIGIREDDRDKVFKIFKRLQTSREFSEGTGAGLTIVKKMVEGYGGKIWFESEEGKGTTFYFTLGGMKVIERKEVVVVE